jgi:hypothetical protein
MRVYDKNELTLEGYEIGWEVKDFCKVVYVHTYVFMHIALTHRAAERFFTQGYIL